MLRIVILGWLAYASFAFADGQDRKDRPASFQQQRKNAQQAARLAHSNAQVSKSFQYLQSERHLYDLLSKRPIRQELGVDFALYQRIETFKKTADRKIIESHNSPEAIVPQGIALQEFEEGIRARYILEVRDSLSKEQRIRLMQVAHYCEIELMGLDFAISKGYLATALGVSENQITHLREVASRLEETEKLTLLESNVALHNRVLAELSEVQRAAAEEMLGPFFDFYQGNWTYVRERRKDLLDELSISDSKSKRADLSSESESRDLLIEWNSRFETKFNLLFNQQVQSDLELTPSQIKAIQSLVPFTSSLKADQAAVFSRKANADLDELLPPDQQKRLDQIVLYLELASHGYAAFFTSNRFSESVNEKEGWRLQLQKKLTTFEQERDLEVREGKKAKIDGILKELSAEQKKAAKEVLGDFFYCPHSLFRYRRDDFTIRTGE